MLSLTEILVLPPRQPLLWVFLPHPLVHLVVFRGHCSSSTPSAATSHRWIMAICRCGRQSRSTTAARAISLILARGQQQVRRGTATRGGRTNRIDDLFAVCGAVLENCKEEREQIDRRSQWECFVFGIRLLMNKASCEIFKRLKMKAPIIYYDRSLQPMPAGRQTSHSL